MSPDVEAHIRKIVAAAPPISPQVRLRLAAILRPDQPARRTAATQSDRKAA